MATIEKSKLILRINSRVLEKKFSENSRDVANWVATGMICFATGVSVSEGVLGKIAADFLTALFKSLSFEEKKILMEIAEENSFDAKKIVRAYDCERMVNSLMNDIERARMQGDSSEERRLSKMKFGMDFDLPIQKW